MPSLLTTAALLALLLGGCGNESGTTAWSSSTDPTVERPEDTGPTDADGDGWTVPAGDCDDGDPDVHPERNEVCDDGTDNDCDALTDCCDSWCLYDSGCAEVCTGGLDEDCDGLVDCRDDDCRSELPCYEAECADSLDNDTDGLVDCQDPDCTGPGCAEYCYDGFDNDADGLVDCEDGDCADFHGCHENCYLPVDTDGDGAVACEDDDCWAEPFCRVMSIRVTGGRAEGWAVSSERSYRWTSTMWSDWDSIKREERNLHLWSVTGTARVRVPGTYGTRTCTWSVPYATVHVEYAYGFEWHGPPDFDPGPFVPLSFHGETGCSFGTGYLPMALDVRRGHGARHVFSEHGGYVWRHEDSWIDGSGIVDHESTVHLEYPSEHWGLFRADIETRSWHISTLSTGVPYTAWMWWPPGWL